MADILSKYGIKEVSDVTFYALGTTGVPTNPVLFLDTLKVSSPETTAESTDARGGKGNPALITWDYNKEITLTLQDALFSVRSLEVMFGSKAVAISTTASATSSAGNGQIMRTEVIHATTNGNLAANGWSAAFSEAGCTATKQNPKIFKTDGTTIASTASLTAGEAYFVTYDLLATEGYVIDISASTFPGTYYITGDTYCRNEANGKDEFFQFIIPKAKVTSESVTITLEAEGDPSVFDMNIRVLRPADGVMMKLVKYSLNEGSATTSGSIIHNHTVNP